MFNDKEYQKAYRVANKEKVTLYQKEYRAKHRDLLKANKKAWRLANPEKVKASNKKRYVEKKESIKAYVSQYKKENPAKVNANKAKRKAVKKLRTPKWLIPIDFERIETQYKLAAILTKLHNSPWHVDHTIPLQGKMVSGLHVPSNLKVIPAKDNLVKSNRFEV